MKPTKSRANRVQYICLGIFLIFFPLGSSIAQVLPPDRVIPWEGNVGVEGGIPNRSNVCNCVTDYNAHADGSDTSSEIQACIDNAPFDGVAYLPAGVYTLSSNIVLKSHKTLRGAGTDSTILLADDMPKVVYIGIPWAPLSAIDISSGYTKGSNQLEFADASSINVGQYVRVDELNDDSIPVTMSGVGDCTWCGRDNGTRVRGQVVKVIAKNGNTITIDPAMYFDFSAGNIPQIQPLGARSATGMSVEYAGIEDLTIKNNGTSYTYERIPVYANNSANCWLKNVRIEKCGARCVSLFYDNFRFELRDSIIYDCFNRFDSNNCYGTLVGAYNSGHLIENNIYESVASGPMFGWGASGNVVGYNYMYDVHRTMNQSSWFMGEGASHHGAHTSFILWEGNELENVYFDQYWGSHSHNTLFRNRVIGKYMIGDIVSDEEYMQNIVAIGTETNVHYHNYVGNVLGTGGYHDTYERNSEGCPNIYYDKLIYRTGYDGSGVCNSGNYDPFDTMLRFMNYDYVTNSVKYCGDPGEPGCHGWSLPASLEPSLYLSSKPSWFGAAPWPAIGPDLTPMSSDIPAKLRFNGQELPTITEDVTGDGEVNALDIQACVNHVLMVQDWGAAADVNNSGSVDAVDIQAIVNEVLRI